MIEWTAFIADWQARTREILLGLPEDDLFPLEREALAIGISLGVAKDTCALTDDLASRFGLDECAADYINFIKSSGGLRLLGMDADDGVLLSPAEVGLFSDLFPEYVDAWMDASMTEGSYRDFQYVIDELPVLPKSILISAISISSNVSGTMFVIARLEDGSCDFIRLSSHISSRKYSSFDEMIMIESERMIENLQGSANFRK